MNTLKLQCRAEIIKMLRNRYYVFWSLLMPIIFYYIFTNVVPLGTNHSCEHLERFVPRE